MNSRLRGSERICSAENHQAFLAYTLFGISVYPDISQAAGRQALWTGSSHNAPLMVSSPSIEKSCTFFCPAFHELENDSGNSEREHVGLSWVQILNSGQIWVLSEGMTELASVPFDLPNSTFIFFMQKKKKTHWKWSHQCRKEKQHRFTPSWEVFNLLPLTHISSLAVFP